MLSREMRPSIETVTYRLKKWFFTTKNIPASRNADDALPPPRAGNSQLFDESGGLSGFLKTSA